MRCSPPPTATASKIRRLTKPRRTSSPPSWRLTGTQTRLNETQRRPGQGAPPGPGDKRDRDHHPSLRGDKQMSPHTTDDDITIDWLGQLREDSGEEPGTEVVHVPTWTQSAW